ncbi:MAG: CAP domain-containing protein [Streptosporangiaceae bacterium]
MTARGSRGSSLALSVLVTVLAVAGAITLVIRLPGRAGEMADAGASASAPPPAVAGASASALTSATPRASASGPAPRHRRAGPRPARSTPSPSLASPTSMPARTAPASTAPAAGLSAAGQQVLALINQARSQAGLAAYTVSSGLDTSAARHTTVMAAGCGLSHQCPGEPALGARETAAGVRWTAAGENIGEGGPVAGTTAAIAQMAVGLTQSMLDEKPPDDGHRLNILSSAFTHVGISVFRDSSGTVWMTQDFSN